MAHLPRLVRLVGLKMFEGVKAIKAPERPVGTLTTNAHTTGVRMDRTEAQPAPPSALRMPGLSLG